MSDTNSDHEFPNPLEHASDKGIPLSGEPLRLLRGHAGDDKPGGLTLVLMHLTSDGDAEGVIERAREVMLRLAHLPLSAFSDLSAADNLPSWFTQAFAPEPADGVIDLQDERWPMSGWLYWMDPDQRPWRWWDTAIQDPNHATVRFGISDWPPPVGALEWLLTACGATSVEYSETEDTHPRKQSRS
ncbi:MAG: hypothetical protein Q4D89_06095 [Arachnia propionica]|uniref:hypothetical protein n=1 Tax=Arachnia propionica TaxID=1750 RepID=UPI0026FAC588|nr:hypothetical protein [Arachnia propionica]